MWARASRGQWVDPRGHPCGHVTCLVLLYIGVGNEGIRPSPKARPSGVPRLTTRTELKEQTQPGPFPAAPGPARNPTDIRALAPFPLNCGRPLGRTAQGQGRGRRAGPPSRRPHSAGPGGPAHSLRWFQLTRALHTPAGAPRGNTASFPTGTIHPALGIPSEAAEAPRILPCSAVSLSASLHPAQAPRI